MNVFWPMAALPVVCVCVSAGPCRYGQDQLSAVV